MLAVDHVDRKAAWPLTMFPAESSAKQTPELTSHETLRKPLVSTLTGFDHVVGLPAVRFVSTLPLAPTTKQFEPRHDIPPMKLPKEPPSTTTGFDHVVEPPVGSVEVKTLPELSPATQKVVLGHDTLSRN